jgi:cytidylate kinase
MSYVITIDGPAASGKTSVSRELASRWGWVWVSTGAFYRGIGFIAQKENIDLDDENELVLLTKSDRWGVFLNPIRTQFVYKGNDVTDEIYSEEVGAIASKISRHQILRENLLSAQRKCALNTSGLVAEGRDCGTVVFPQADVKFYLTAKSENRAQRRANEQGASIEATKKAQKIRDIQDSNRSVAPLQVPENAHVIDTSEMDLQQVVESIDKIIHEHLKI